MASVKAEKDLADYTREAIAKLPHKRILTKEEMRQVMHDAVKANALARIKPDDEDWVKQNKEKVANMLADLTSKQLDYQWPMQYALWSSFLRQA